MKYTKPVQITFSSLLCAVLGCASSSSDDTTSGSGGNSPGSSSSSTSASGGSGGAGGSGQGGNGTGGDSSSGGGTGTGGAAQGSDPDTAGPYQFATIDDAVPPTNGASGGPDMAIRCAYPTSGPTAGPYPVIVVAHGFQLPATQYTSYVDRLASHGFVALTVDFPTSLTAVNNINNADDLIKGLDWAAAKPELSGKVNVSLAGMTGHSLGGKLALLAAKRDPRIKAVIGLDPVDGSMNCNPDDCPDVSDIMPFLNIPTGFLGEVTDSTGKVVFGFPLPACAPATDNYTTFYDNAVAPSLEVTIAGASHMSFLDDPNCGFACSACQDPTTPLETIGALSRAYVVAFYERYLRNNTEYDTYLTGAQAQARYVTTNIASIRSK